MADDLHLAADLAGFINNSNGGLFHRGIEADKVLHAALPFLMLVAVRTDYVLSSARSAAPSCITVGEGVQAEYPIYRKKSQFLDQTLIRKPYSEVAHFSVEKPTQFRVKTNTRRGGHCLPAGNNRRKIKAFFGISRKSFPPLTLCDGLSTVLAKLPYHLAAG
jgi:hypothetical protein